MEKMISGNKSKMGLQELVLSSLLIALTLVFTFFINVRLPIASNGGLIHLGNVPLFVGAILFGKRAGFLAGSFGMALFDLLSGWTLWAPFTFVIVGCMGYVVGTITERKKSIPWVVLALILAGVIKIAGYYIAEWIIFGNAIIPMGSIPGNAIQVGLAGVITLLILPVLQKVANVHKNDRGI